MLVIGSQDEDRNDDYYRVEQGIQSAGSEIPDDDIPLNAGSNLEPEEQSNHDPWKYKWFQRTVVLIYLLSVLIGANLFYAFAFRQEMSYLGDVNSSFAMLYLALVCIDLCLVQTFVFLSLLVEDIYPGERSLQFPFKRWWTETIYTRSLDVGVLVLLGLSSGYLKFTIIDTTPP